MIEPVVDDAGDLGAVLVDLRLPLDHRRDDQDLVRRAARLVALSTMSSWRPTRSISVTIRSITWASVSPFDTW